MDKKAGTLQKVFIINMLLILIRIKSGPEILRCTIKRQSCPNTRQFLFLYCFPALLMIIIIYFIFGRV